MSATKTSRLWVGKGNYKMAFLEYIEFLNSRILVLQSDGLFILCLVKKAFKKHFYIFFICPKLWMGGGQKSSKHFSENTHDV